MGRCNKCVLISVATIRGRHFQHRESLRALKVSAETGCSLCNLFWTQLKNSCTKTAIDMHLADRKCPNGDRTNTKIYLTGDLQDPGSGFLNQSFNQGSNVWVSSGEIDEQSSDPNVRVTTYLQVFAEPGTPAAEYMPGRWFGTRGNLDQRLAMVNSWTRECIKHHAKCGGDLAREMPTRVIDVGDPVNSKPPSLFLTDGLHGRYVALSYSWGPGIRPQVRLLESNLEDLRRKIPENELAQCHQEALQLTRLLGFRYIWIDALCIIQKQVTREDWDKEALKMTQTYGNACLTIVAGWSDNCQNSFLDMPLDQVTCVDRKLCYDLDYSRPDLVERKNITRRGAGRSRPDIRRKRTKRGSRKRRQKYKKRLFNKMHSHRVWATKEMGKCYVGPKRSIDPGAVDKRAWCFQESILSRRMIIFGEEQLSFKCQVFEQFEDGSAKEIKGAQNARYITSEFSFLQSGISVEEGKLRVLRRWYEMLARYQERLMFDPFDLFAALSGIAQIVQRGLDCRYLAGLWEDDMIKGLLWRSALLLSGPKSHTLLRRPNRTIFVDGKVVDSKEVVRAPSWSWAAVEGPVQHLSSERRELMYRNVADFKCWPVDEAKNCWSQDDSNPYMTSITSCELQIHGNLKKVRRSRVPASGYTKRPKWTYSLAKIKKHCVLLEPDLPSGEAPDLASHDHVVALGLFDIPNEHATFSCMRLISQEGLILIKNEQGKYLRLGVFCVEDEAWFQDGVVEQIHLI